MARPVDPAEFSDLTIRVEEQVAEEEEQGVEQGEEQEATMANRTNKSLEETRVRARRVRGAARRVTAADFTDLTLEQTVVADKRRTRPAARTVDAAEFSDLTLTEEVEEQGVAGEQRVVEEEVEEGGDTTQPRSGISSGYMEALGRDTDSLTLARERLTPQSTKESHVGQAATNSVILARRRLDPDTEEKEEEVSPERAAGRRSTATTTSNILEVAEEQRARSEVLWAQRAARKGEAAVQVVAAAPELSNIGEESGEGSRPVSREGSRPVSREG